MKRKQKLALLVVLGSQLAIAQWVPTPGALFLRTSPPNQGVGVGNFPNAALPSSRLHVNNFFTANPNGPLNGFMFRTDGSNAVHNNWQMFTGATSATTVEKFRISSLFFSTFTPGPNDKHKHNAKWQFIV